MAKCINSGTGDSYIRIDEGSYAYDDYFYPHPPEFIFIDLFFITLASPDGDDYLLLDYVGYIDPIDLKNNEKSLLSVPYTSFHVPIGNNSGINRPSQYGAICQMFRDFMKDNSREIEAAEAQLRYGMGIPWWITEEGSTYLEYKHSVTSGIQKCYCIREHFVKDVGQVGELNIVDPDRLFPHRYFHIEESDVYEWDNAGKRIIFQNRHIPENVRVKGVRHHYKTFFRRIAGSGWGLYSMQSSDIPLVSSQYTLP